MRRRLHLMVFAMMNIAPGLVRAQNPGRLLDGVAAIVGGSSPSATTDVVLRSDVDLRCRIVAAGQAQGMLSLVPLPPELWRATLDQIVGELLIAREARRVGVASPGPEAIERERVKLAELAGGLDRLRALLELLGATNEEFESVAVRRALVTAFVNANLGLVSDSDVERAFAAGNHPFTDRPFAEIRDAFRSWLVARATDRAERRWMAVLAARAVVRVLAAP